MWKPWRRVLGVLRVLRILRVLRVLRVIRYRDDGFSILEHTLRALHIGLTCELGVG